MLRPGGIGHRTQKIVLVEGKAEPIEDGAYAQVLTLEVVVLVVEIIDDAAAIGYLRHMAVGVVRGRSVGCRARIIHQHLAIQGVVGVLGDPRAADLTREHVAQGIAAVRRHARLGIFHRGQIEPGVIVELAGVPIEIPILRERP